MTEELGPKAHAAALDIRSTESLEALAAKLFSSFGRVRVLVNNVGVRGGRGLLDTPKDEIDWFIQVNLKSAWRGTSVFGKRMREQTTPNFFFNIGSANSLGYISRGPGIYTAGKHGVVGICNILRHELPSHMKVCEAWEGLVTRDLTRSSTQTAPRLQLN